MLLALPLLICYVVMLFKFAPYKWH